MTVALRGVWLGRRRYEPVHALQEKLLAARQGGAIGDTLLFVEHDPVVTLGRGAKNEHLLATPDALAELGVDLVRTGRGGDVTLHAPGQLVAYPIFDLSPDRRDVRRYVNALTEVMRRLSSELGIEAGKHHEHVGLWVDRDSPSAYPGSAASKDLAKIGAVGVRISRWCTMHGFALNLAPDLSLYRVIVPCGIRELGVSSIATLGGAPIAIETAARRAFELFGAVFEARLERFDDRSGSSLESLVEKSSPAVTASRT